MTLKKYLWVMAALTAFCWAIFLFVAGLVDPTATNWLGFLLLLITLLDLKNLAGMELDK